MASISSLGVGSGIFSADLVDQLVAAEREPTVQRLNLKQQRTEAMISAYGALRSAIEALKAPMEALSSPDGLKAFSAVSSNESLGVTIDEAAVSRGSYSINVTQLAQAQSLASSSFADKDTTTVGTGTLTLDVGGVATEIVIDGSNNTLQGVADAINDAGAGVSAGVVDTGSGFRLVISSDETGLENAIQVSVADDDGNNTDVSGLSQFVFDGVTSNLEETVKAKDALMEINGIAISRPTNVVEDVVAGVTFTVSETGASTVRVEQDAGAVSERVQEFVDKFNALQDVISSVAGFNSASGQGGILSGDSTIRSIQSSLRGLLTTIVPGMENSDVRTLGDVGITTDPSTGKLEFDQSVFKEKLKDHPDQVTALFAEQDGVEGIAEQAVNLVTDILASDSALSNRTDGLSNALDRIQDQRDQLDLRMESLRERLVRQFTAADSLIAQLNSTGSFVLQQLAALAPQNNQNS
ncbi:flagellar filament capping protein FliD [Marinobacter zhejiangensis]|uniref:Flagellar hook-associated protein 2 n=1 Tax=Marinobacter zhejiangensis TaxID=488535 RepID=A0A1I4QS05_9GAMM|nr:flagellar filament capping protein FliD [Marinobacter zhejiangensis]SFM42473.1 flagellar hook-associated protein 2 [Marinobacter zhejiangensis]